MGERTDICKENVTNKACTKKMGGEVDKKTSRLGIYRLEPSLRKATIKLHARLTKELSLLVIQMCMRKIALCKFLFHQKVPEIENKRCKCRQSNQTIKVRLARV